MRISFIVRLFFWIPSHVNIRGHERADTAAKDALSLPPMSMKLPSSELKPCISRFCLEEWQDIWNCAANNKLHAIYATAGNPIQNNLVSRRDAVIINRLKIGHSCVTHSYLLSGDDQPTCIKCYSEAYTSGLSCTPGRPAEILHCSCNLGLLH